MKPYDANVLMTTVLFQATVHQNTFVMGKVFGKTGDRLMKWQIEGRKAIKQMNWMLGEAEADIEPLTIAVMEILRELLEVEDKEHFINYLNSYKQVSELSGL